MPEMGDTAALWKRIEAWPGELKQALIAQVNAQARVDELQRQLDRAREHDDEEDDYSGFSDEAAQQRRKLARAREEVQEARDKARVRILNEYKSRNERLPAQAFVQSLVEADAEVTAKRETLKKIDDEDDVPLRPTQALSLLHQMGTGKQTESEEVKRLERELASAEVAAELAGVEVKHQRAIGRSLAMLVRLSARAAG